MPELDNISFITDQKLPYFLIRGRIDFDGNGKFDHYDPYRLFQWNYESHDISPFPGEAITDDLQKVLEGRKLAPQNHPDNSSPSAPAVTVTISPSRISPAKIKSASLSCSARWITRFKGRAP